MSRSDDELACLVRPMPIAALVVLAANDHVLKHSALAGTITGKLSDVAGLVLLPILGTAVTRALLAAGRRPRPPGLATIWCAATAVGFALLKLDPHVNRWASRGWGTNTLDPTDLFALPAIAFAWMHLRRTHGGATSGAWPAFGRAACVGIAGWACMATPAAPPPPPRPFVAWTVTSDAGHEVGCARARAWVSKSGKTGVGLTVRLENPSPRSAGSAR